MKNKGIVILITIVLLIGVFSYLIFYKRPSQPINTKTITPTIIPSSENNVFPKGGETFHQGQSYILKWASGSGNTNIFLVDTAYESQGVSVSLVDRVYNIPNSGSYTYTVPRNLPNGTYKFEIGNITTNTFQISNSNQ